MFPFLIGYTDGSSKLGVLVKSLKSFLRTITEKSIEQMINDANFICDHQWHSSDENRDTSTIIDNNMIIDVVDNYPLCFDT